MSRTTQALALTLSTLLFASATLAGPKRPPAAAPLHTALTPTERLCAENGRLIRDLAQYRDRGVSLLTLLARVRQSFPKGVHTYVEGLTRLVYDFPHVAPATLQQEVERGCVQLSDPEPNSSVGTLRY